MIGNNSLGHDLDGDESSAVVPMIELLLIVLLFFVVNYSRTGQSPVPLPVGRSQPGAEAHPVQIVVDRDGGLMIDGESFESDALVGHLRREQPSSVLIYAHEDVLHRHVVSAWSLCREAGVLQLAEGVENR